MNVALTFAIIGSVTGVVALGWQLVAWLWSGPRITVLLRATVHAWTAATPPERRPEESWTLRIIVANPGRAAATIEDVGFVGPDGRPRFSVQEARDNNLDVTGPPLPTRIDSHGAEKWEALGTKDVRPRVGGAAGDPAYGWAELFTSRRKHSRDRTRRMGTRRVRSAECLKGSF